jgi:DNA-nicking Smr family endonuclease
MGKDDRTGKRKPTPLPPDDDALWRRVAGTARPLIKGKNRVVDVPDIPRGDEPPPPARKKKQHSDARSAPVAQQRKPPSPPPLGAYDRRETRALAAGRVEIDSRIDLHGMRQREAHAALGVFLARAQRQGHRHVLVITGKGGRASEEGIERGVLNREVPRWLSEPDFRQMVVSTTQAHKRHGGEGALYVRLRKSGKVIKE